jgi:ubiquinone biosynthesis monooxygenase Coq7
MVDPDIASMLRVAHAGEYGADRIYAGQRAVMGNRARVSAEVAHMASQEQAHLADLADLLARHRARPSLLMPLWHAAGYALGVASALAGEKTAMAVTAAVETEIDRHYQAQREELAETEPALAATLAGFQAEEAGHRDLALAHGAADAPGWPLLSRAIRAGCRLSIALARRF